MGIFNLAIREHDKTSVTPTGTQKHNEIDERVSSWSYFFLQFSNDPFNDSQLCIGIRDHNVQRNPKGHSEHNERAPEWMDYDPENDSATKNKETEAKENEPEFVNDLEAWKSKMKKQDQERHKEAESQSQSAQNDDSEAEKTGQISSTPTDGQPQATQGKGFASFL